MAVSRVERWMVAAILAWCALAARRAQAADPLRLIGESPRTLQRFAEAADLESQRRWADAVGVYLRILDEVGDDWVHSGADARNYRPARAVVHRRLAARPELLAPYRDRVEARARRLLEQGEAQHDPQALAQVVDNFFCSRSAEKALHLLGDMACERGDFAQARHYWRLLEPAAAPTELAYPDPTGDVALLQAKQILARLLAGERDEAAVAFQVFRAAHPSATGYLAGKQGNLASTLQQLLDAPDLIRVPTLAGMVPAPTTFAGDASRNGVLTGLLPPFSPQPRYPPISLPGAVPSGDHHLAMQRPLIRPAALAFQPVIAHGQVFVADAFRVTAYDLATGRLSGQFDLSRTDPRLADLRDLRLPSNSDARYTLTVAGDRIFVRLGVPTMRPDRGEAASYLACLQWRPGGDTPAERLHQRWLLPAMKPGAEAGPVMAFEGTPVVRDDRLYVAVTRLDGNRATTALACYDAGDPVAAGPLWQHDVYEAGADTAERARQHLVTLAGQKVIYCSHAGVIVALEAATGRRAWAIRYATRGPRTASGEPSPRDLLPCVAADGRIYAAPADCDRVLCLDAATGTPLWQSDRMEVAQLLGVAHGRLVCTTGGFLSGLCALDAATGRRVVDWGYRTAGAEALAPFGRGLLCGDRVYWPTRGAGVQELRWDGTLVYAPTAFQSLPGGNLAYGEGCLVVATADRLHVLIGAATATAGPAAGVGDNPPGDANPFQAALALADTGQVTAALDRLREAEQAAASDGDLHDRLRRYRQELLHWRADRLRLAGRWAERSESEQSPSNDGRPLTDAGGKLVSPPRTIPSDRTEVPHGAAQDPSWRPPLELKWRLALDAGERVLVPDGGGSPIIPDSKSNHDGMVLTAVGTRLRCRSVPDGATAWERPLAFVPTWLAVDAEDAIVAGCGGLARLARGDGHPIWDWPAPVAAPWLHPTAGWRDPDVGAPPQELSDLHATGGRIFARLGEGSLFAIDGATGTVLWQREAPLMSRFFRQYYADESAVVVQTSTGQRWHLDAATGATLHTAPASAEPWPEPPLALGDGFALVTDDERVTAVDARTGQADWEYSLPHWSSLAGALPRMRRSGDSVIVGIVRNDCFEVVRLDRFTGQPRGEPIAVGREPIDLAAVAADGRGWCVADGHTLRTLTAEPIAARELPATAAWRVERPHPDWWLLWTTPRVSATEPPPREGRLILLPRRPQDGRGQQFTFDRFGSHGGVWLVRDGAVVVTVADVRFYRSDEQGAK